MRPRAAASGMPSAISRSKRPARRSAGSSASGRLVAPITMTIGLAAPGVPPDVVESNCEPPPAASSSMHVSIWATMRFSISRCADSRLGAMASISSMKRSAGATSRASLKTCRILASLSPDMPETTSGAEMRTKPTPSSPAIAHASNVLPQPGGPCSNSPRGGATPRCA
eukprot:scaffold310753_cov26-Tisochrysis_lutea.AAC.1